MTWDENIYETKPILHVDDSEGSEDVFSDGESSSDKGDESE